MTSRINLVAATDNTALSGICLCSHSLLKPNVATAAGLCKTPHPETLDSSSELNIEDHTLFLTYLDYMQAAQTLQEQHNQAADHNRDVDLVLKE